MSLVGRIAPDFDLACTVRPERRASRVALGDFQGRWLILVFYPRDFSLVCPTELTALSARIDELGARGCEVLGVSTDDLATHERWIATPESQGGLGGLNFRLASDSEGTASQAFGVLLEGQRVALRGLFVIDPNGVVQFESINNLSVGRKSDEIVRIVGALQTGGMCAEDWCLDCSTIDPTSLIRPGTVISHYQIESEAGRGTFASVYRAHDRMLDRTVALKVFRPGNWSSELAAASEARAAAALDHPNVCAIFAVDDSEGVPIIVMEFLDGEPLSARVVREAMPVDSTATVVRQVASGMAAAHDEGIVHGDLKPANIMLLPDGVAKIMDFGLARREFLLASGDDTASLGLADEGNVSGTPNYMSPEQTRGERATPECDVFSLGLIAYELLTGQKAFSGDNVLRVFEDIREVEPEGFAAALPSPFDDIVRVALAPSRSNRKITMQQIVETLSAT